MDLRVVNVTSTSAVIVWSPIPPHLANGDVRYVVRIAPVSTPHYTIEESLRQTKLKVTGIEADTVHLVTVTGHTGKGAGPSSEVMQFRTLKNSELKAHTHYTDRLHSTHTLRTPTHAHSPTHPHTHTSACLPSVHVCSHGDVVCMHSYSYTVCTLYVHAGGSSSSTGPSPSTSEGVTTLPTNTHVIPNSPIPIPTLNIGIETGEGSSSATPGDVAAIFMAILYIATIGTVVAVVVVFLVNRRYLREKNSQTNDVETKEDKSRSNSPELVWYQPGDRGTNAQIRDDQDAVSSTSC